ncbi:MAG: pyridoxal phosphate-dependent aminotransferase [Clostridia bacterium]|nr:pyridoxal phosphate-dependent aminotransferase [Clostridia bacterium]
MPERNLGFDRIIPRRSTKSLKWDKARERGVPEEALPMWVADMDFETSSYVEDALAARARHGIYGYSEPLGEYFPAVSGWMQRRHGWKPEEEWLVRTPGVVFALAMAVRAYTESGDAVLIQQPVYYPFSEVIRDNGRRIVSSDLRLGADGRYEMDMDDLEQKIRSEHVRLMLLCSPHNPVGRVWSAEELKAVGRICKRHGVTVVSDEIHSDLVFSGKHRIFTDVDPGFTDFSLVLTSPSKTFNLAGLLLSNIFIPSRDLRRRFRREVEAAGISQLSPFGLDACEAAYTKGEQWYAAMMDYVRGNIRFAREFTEQQLPGIRLMPHEGTYLLWLDCRDLGLDSSELDRRILHEAGLWLDSGRIFGPAGEGFQRLNAACPRPVLQEAFARLRKIL